MVVFMFFFFRLQMLFLGSFGPKIQKCQFKLKTGYLDYSKWIKLDGDVTYSALNLFLEIFSKKIIWYFHVN